MLISCPSAFLALFCQSAGGSPCNYTTAAVQNFADPPEACVIINQDKKSPCNAWCRPALLVGAELSVSNEEEMRADWLVNTGWQLPEIVPYYLKVSFSEDADAPVVIVPSCCVLSSSGLNIQPASARTSIGLKVLQALTGVCSWMSARCLFSIHIMSNAKQ